MSWDLQDILHPYPIDTFFRENLRKRPVYVSGAQERFDSLLPWQAVNRIVGQGNLVPPRVMLVKDGRPLPESAYVMTRKDGERKLALADLFAEVRDGATLVLNGVDEMDSEVRELAARVESRFRVRLQVNAYAAWGDERGFGCHWDNHDVLVLQVSGRKHWLIKTEPEPSPLDKFDPAAAPAPASTEWSGHLCAGDVLYVPRGWWHEVTPCGAPTLHLTVGIPALTSMNVLRWLVDRMQSDEWIRRDIPGHENSQPPGDYLETLERKLISELHQPKLLQAFFTAASAAGAARGPCGLPWNALEDPLPAADASIHASSPFARVLDNADGTADVGFDGQIITLGAGDVHLVRWILENAPVRLARFSETAERLGTRNDARELLRSLSQCGFIYFAQSQAPGGPDEDVAERIDAATAVAN